MVELEVLKITNNWSNNSSEEPFTIKAETTEEAFRKFYANKRIYRYCDDITFTFKNKSDKEAYENWYNSLSREEQFNMYYDGGIVD